MCGVRELESAQILRNNSIHKVRHQILQLPTGHKLEGMETFKAARLYHPPKVNSMQPTVGDVDSLSNFPLIDAERIEQLKNELPLYCADTDCTKMVENK